MSEIKNGESGVYGAEHSKCNRIMTLGFKGLIQAISLNYKTLTITQPTYL